MQPIPASAGEVREPRPAGAERQRSGPAPREQPVTAERECAAGQCHEQADRDEQRGVDAGAGQRSLKPTLTREVLAKMSPAEVAQLDWEEVRRVLAAS